MDGGDQESHQLSCQVEPACPQGEGHSHRVTWAELDLCWQHQQHRREQEALELAKQRARRLLPPRMESGAAARDHLHSQSCARGASLFQLDLLRENPTPAVLAAPSWRVLVPRYLYSDTFGPSFFLHLDWVLSTHGRNPAASRVQLAGSSGCWRGWQHSLSCWHCCLRQTDTPVLPHSQLVLNSHCSSPSTALLLRSCQGVFQAI